MLLKKWITFSLSIMNLGLIGCMHHQPMPNDKEYAPAQPIPVIEQGPRNGAIYSNETAMSLFEDNRARRVGDLVTITLDERTDATKKATTKAKKENVMTIANPTILGTTPQFKTPGIIPLASNRDNNLGFGFNSDTDFEGEGESKQNNSLNGTITVTVAEVMPNGNLIVRGEKWITLNQGEEYIRIRGIVRPQDISPDNTVSSLKVADARITYSGKGQVADSNVMGWLSRFFISALWPW